MAEGGNPWAQKARPDEVNREMGELLGGDALAYRIARVLRADGITDLDALRAEYEKCYPDVRKGYFLEDLPRFGPTVMERIAAILDPAASTAPTDGR